MSLWMVLVQLLVAWIWIGCAFATPQRTHKVLRATENVFIKHFWQVFNFVNAFSTFPRTLSSCSLSPRINYKFIVLFFLPCICGQSNESCKLQVLFHFHIYNSQFTIQLHRAVGLRTSQLRLVNYRQVDQKSATEHWKFTEMPAHLFAS